MGQYMAMKPVRFDKKYAAGETIPDGVINPGRVKRLIEWGMIQPVVSPAGAGSVAADFLVHLLAFTKKMLSISCYDGAALSPDERAELCSAQRAAFIELAEKAAAIAGVSEIMDGMPGEGEQISDSSMPHTHPLPANTEDAPQEYSEGAFDPDAAEGGPASFVCQVCGKVCANKAALTSHMKTHG